MKRFALFLVLVSACASANYRRQAGPPVQANDWVMAPRMQFVAQKSPNDCGYAVLDILRQRWNLPAVAGATPGHQPRDKGLRAHEMKRLLEDMGMRAFIIPGTYEDLVQELHEGRPVVVGTYDVEDDKVLGHYQVVAGVARSGRAVLLIDPARGWTTRPFADFDKLWELSKRVAIVAMPAETSSPSAPDATPGGQ